jgi:competence protein ComEC
LMFFFLKIYLLVLLSFFCMDQLLFLGIFSYGVEMKKIKSKIILVILSSLTLLFLVVLDWPDPMTRVIFCDVGQGDAVLITHGFSQIIIDSGANNSISTCLNNHMPFWDRQIDLAIVTHADKDHIGGFETVLNEFFVEKMIVSKLGKKTGVFMTFRELVLREKKEGMELILINDVVELKMSDDLVIKNYLPRVAEDTINPFLEQITETMLWDQIEQQEGWLSSQGIDLNALSVVSIIDIGEVTFLLTGDLYVDGEQALIRDGLIGDTDVLKVGHHGSKTSTSDLLMKVASPEISVVSVGKNNNYRHPNPQVLAKLEAFGTQILRTDERGDVVVKTDGQSYWIE